MNMCYKHIHITTVQLDNYSKPCLVILQTKMNNGSVIICSLLSVMNTMTKQLGKRKGLLDLKVTNHHQEKPGQ